MKIFMLGIPPCCDLGIYAMRRPGDNSMPRPADTPHATALGIITGDYDHMLRYRVFFYKWHKIQSLLIVILDWINLRSVKVKGKYKVRNSKKQDNDKNKKRSMWLTIRKYINNLSWAERSFVTQIFQFFSFQFFNLKLRTKPHTVNSQRVYIHRVGCVGWCDVK